MNNRADKKKRPILAAFHSPLQAFLPVGMYRADSFVSTVATIDQLPAAASNPWSIRVGVPAHRHISLCGIQTLASTLLLSLISLATYSGFASNSRTIQPEYDQTVSAITLYFGLNTYE